MKQPIGNPMPYNLQTASLATGVHKSTILRSIRGGRLSATRDAGNWSIEVAELHRVFPPLPAPASAEATAGQPPVLHAATPDSLVEVLREALEDMRQERDRWHAAYEASEARLQRLLPPPAANNVAPSNLDIDPGNPWRRAWRWMQTPA
jgi:hypothetical protein